MKTEADTNSPQRVNRIDPRRGLFHSRSSYNSRYCVEIKNDTSTGRLDDSEAVVGVKRGGEAFPTSKRQESRARLNPSRPLPSPILFALTALARFLPPSSRQAPPFRLATSTSRASPPSRLRRRLPPPRPAHHHLFHRLPHTTHTVKL